MTSDERRALVAIAALSFALLACKHTYTPPGTADASADAMAGVARPPAPSGSCKPATGDSLVADETCTPDKRGACRCGPVTEEWKLEARPGGCDYTPTTHFIICK
ncbi:MAG TPA: hypothetical protein VGH28_33665 [Polyangiaceae bacterium]